MDAVAARHVLEEWVAGQRLPYNKPDEGMARTARRLRLVEESREVSARERAAEETLKQLAGRGRVLDDQSDDLAVLLPAGWLNLSRAVLTVNLGPPNASRTQRVHLWAAALEGWISQRSAEKLLDRIEAELRRRA